MLDDPLPMAKVGPNVRIRDRSHRQGDWQGEYQYEQQGAERRGPASLLATEGLGHPIDRG